MRLNFANFRRKWSIFNKERAAKSQIFVKSGQFSNKERGGVGSGRVKISPIFVENSKFASEECASISQIVVENSLFSKKGRCRKITNVRQNCQFSNKERGVSDRVGSNSH